MKIDINKKYRTSSAKWPITIVSTDGPYPGFPVVGYAHHSGTPLLCHWTEVGAYPANTNLDLVEVREPMEWVVRSFHNGRPAIWSGPNMEPEQEIRVREIID